MLDFIAVKRKWLANAFFLLGSLVFLQNKCSSFLITPVIFGRNVELRRQQQLQQQQTESVRRCESSASMSFSASRRKCRRQARLLLQVSMEMLWRENLSHTLLSSKIYQFKNCRCNGLFSLLQSHVPVYEYEIRHENCLYDLMCTLFHALKILRSAYMRVCLRGIYLTKY